MGAACAMRSRRLCVPRPAGSWRTYLYEGGKLGSTSVRGRVRIRVRARARVRARVRVRVRVRARVRARVRVRVLERHLAGGQPEQLLVQLGVRGGQGLQVLLD